MIEVRYLSKSFGDVRALDQVSFSVSAGDSLVILGPSGSGKTTLLRLVAGLEIPDQGEIFIDGKLASEPSWVLSPYQRGTGLGLPLAQAAPEKRLLPSNPVTPSAMPMRNLGKTGYQVGLFSLGGQASVEKPDNEAVAVPIVERALDLGVNYIDTAARYGGDERWSQRYFRQVMKRRRSQAFLASKTHDRTRDGSLKLLEDSLRLLQTDHLDLWQIHNLARMEEVEAIFAKGGAVEALVEAKEKGLVRNIGVTARGPRGPDRGRMSTFNRSRARWRTPRPCMIARRSRPCSTRSSISTTSSIRRCRTAPSS